MTQNQDAVEAIHASYKQDRYLRLYFHGAGDDPIEVTVSANHLEDTYGSGTNLIDFEVVPKRVGRTEFKITTPFVGQLKAVLRAHDTSAGKIKKIAEMVAQFEGALDEPSLLDTYDK